MPVYSLHCIAIHYSLFSVIQYSISLFINLTVTLDDRALDDLLLLFSILILPTDDDDAVIPDGSLWRPVLDCSMMEVLSILSTYHSILESPWCTLHSLFWAVVVLHCSILRLLSTLLTLGGTLRCHSFDVDEYLHSLCYCMMSSLFHSLQWHVVVLPVIHFSLFLWRACAVHSEWCIHLLLHCGSIQYIPLSWWSTCIPLYSHFWCWSDCC